MICGNILDNEQPCGDEGRLCDACLIEAEQAYTYLKYVPRHQVIDDERSREEFNQELRDAGRGHLVRS
jgi:hypothetical protein